MTAEEFGEIIRERREAMGLTQVALGKLIGRGGAAICCWERGDYIPSQEMIESLGWILRLDDATVDAALAESLRHAEENRAKIAAGKMDARVMPSICKPRKVCGLTSMQQTAAIARAANAQGLSYGAYAAALTEEERERIYRKYARYLQLRARMEAGQK